MPPPHTSTQRFRPGSASPPTRLLVSALPLPGPAFFPLESRPSRLALSSRFSKADSQGSCRRGGDCKVSFTSGPAPPRSAWPSLPRVPRGHLLPWLPGLPPPPNRSITPLMFRKSVVVKRIEAGSFSPIPSEVRCLLFRLHFFSHYGLKLRLRLFLFCGAGFTTVSSRLYCLPFPTKPYFAESVLKDVSATLCTGPKLF